MKSDKTTTFIVALLVIQAGVSVSLWVLNSITISSTTAFALLLAADVLIFAAVCHTYFFSDAEAETGALPGQSSDEQQAQGEETHSPPVAA